jgi:hypothetical protein
MRAGADLIIYCGVRCGWCLYLWDMRSCIGSVVTRVLREFQQIVLIYALDLSFYIESSVKLNIHNQCLNVDLVSLTYITNGELECHRPPNYKVCAGDTMRSGFIIKSCDVSYGALICRLQKKQSHESTRISEDISSAAHLLVVWEISESERLYVDVLLVECDKKLDLDKDDLEALYRKNSNRFRLCPDSAKDTWSLDDDTALMITFNIMNDDYILDITISEVKRCSGAKIPVHVDPER